MSTTGHSPGDWKPGEYELRKDEVAAALGAAKTQKRAIRWQFATVIAAFASIVTSAAIGYMAIHDARNTAESAQKISMAQADQNQLAIAMNALGSDQSAQRIAGLLLLERNAITGLVSLPEGTNEAFNRYNTVLQIFGSYIQDHSPIPTGPSSGSSNSFGPGYGIPSPGSTTIDLYYAARQLQRLLAAQDSVRNLHFKGAIYIDMSNSELWGVVWTGIRFDWLSGAFLRHIDLRGAYLENSRWGKADLENSYLQCADLEGANLQGTDLSGADLRGADIKNANFSGAILRRTKLAGVVGKAKGLSPGKHPQSSWNQKACENNRGYWDNAPS